MSETNQNERMVKPRLVLEAIKKGHHWVKQIGIWIRTDGKTPISDRQVQYHLKRLESADEVVFRNYRWELTEPYDADMEREY